jgi:hypothetical protein
MQSNCSSPLEFLLTWSGTPENITYHTPRTHEGITKIPNRERLAPISNQEFETNPGTHLPNYNDQSSTSIDHREGYRHPPHPSRNTLDLTHFSDPIQLLNYNGVTPLAPTTSLPVVANLKGSSTPQSSQTQEPPSEILPDNSFENGHIIDHDGKDVGKLSRSKSVSMEMWLDPKGEPSPWVNIGSIERDPILASTKFPSIIQFGKPDSCTVQSKEEQPNDEIEFEGQLADKIRDCRNRVFSTYQSRTAFSRAGAANGRSLTEPSEVLYPLTRVNQNQAVGEETKSRLEKNVLFDIVQSVHHEATTRLHTCSWRDDKWTDEFNLGLRLLHQDRPQEALPILLGSLAATLLKKAGLLRGEALPSRPAVLPYGQLEGLHTCLHKICISFNDDEYWTPLGCSTSRYWSEITENLWETRPKYIGDLILETIKIANALSLRDRFEFGNYLFPVLEPSFEVLNDSMDGYKMVRALAERSLFHYQPQKKWKEATTDIIRAYQIIHVIMLSKGQMDQIAELIALLESTLANIPMREEAAGRMGYSSSVFQRPAGPLFSAGKTGGSVRSRNSTKSSTTNTTGSRSSRYGITYTDSVITGVGFDYSALFPQRS